MGYKRRTLAYCACFSSDGNHLNNGDVFEKLQRNGYVYLFTKVLCGLRVFLCEWTL